MDKVISMKSVRIWTIEPELNVNIFFFSPIHVLKKIVIILRIFIEVYINTEKVFSSEIPEK